MKRKWLSIGIIIFFVGTIFVPFVTSERTHIKNVITVDDEPGDALYTTISEALLYADQDDTIVVYSGDYPEWNISVGISNLILQGIDQELGSGNDTGLPFVHSIIENDSNAIFSLVASNISLSNFTVQNVAWNAGWSDVAILSDCCVVSGCEFRGQIDVGVLVYCGFSEVSNNTFNHCRESVNLRCNNTLVADNLITDSCQAIHVEGILGGYYVYNNTIVRNTVISPLQFSVQLSRTRNVTVSYNNFYGGVWGICIEDINSDAYIVRNSISDTQWAIFINGYFLERSNHIIKENNIINSSIFLTCSIVTAHIELEKNYWTDYFGVGPKIVWGHKIIFEIFLIMGTYDVLIPWIYIDWYPAKEPYDIP